MSMGFRGGFINDKLHCPYGISNIVMVIKYRNFRWAGDLFRMKVKEGFFFFKMIVYSSTRKT